MIISRNPSFIEKGFLGASRKNVSQDRVFRSPGFECRIVGSQLDNDFFKKLQLRIPFSSGGISWRGLLDPQRSDCWHIAKSREIQNSELSQEKIWSKLETMIITSKSVHRSKFHRHPLRGYRYIITLYRYTTTY